MQVRNLIQTVKDRLRHPGEEFDQGYAGIADVMIGPLPCVMGNPFFRLVDQLLECAVVKLWYV